MTEEVIKRIRERYFGVPLLALGQTVFWDEPTKIALKYWLDRLYPEAVFIFGVHNTDYFAKSPIASDRDEYILISHNDNSTRDLWASTIEISRPFGSENHPTLQFFRRCNVPLDNIAPEDRKNEFLDEITSCWGWMAVVKSGTRSIVACDVRLQDVLKKLLEIVEWGTCGAKDLIGEKGCVRDFCDRIREFIVDYADKNRSATVTDLFKELYKWFWRELIGYVPQDIPLTSSLELFRFNTDTYHLPRFSIIEGFLNPATSSIYKNSYNTVVKDSGIYTLDHFAYGAIPFDLVIPGRERGTICIQPRALIIEGEEEIRVPLDSPITTLKDLAEVIERNFGKDSAIVGKAVVLLSMIRSEFILVFNERGSLYYNLTFKMEELLEKEGIDIRFYPILRLRYHTWDLIDRIDGEIVLPSYMRVAFGKERIDPIEFKDRWRYVVEEQNDFIYRLASMRKSREIMSFLSEIRGKEWEERLSLYNQLKQEIISRRQPIEKNWQMVREMKERLREIKDPVERRTIREQLRRLRDDTWKMEKSEEIKRLREALKTLEIESERAKAEILRYSYLVKENLPYTNCRPSAWWFIAMDPSRRWFKSIVESLKIYTEGERCRDYNLQRCIQ
jgi:bifunctional DNA-binding transcriptional regulator/antitoxin component of YhaV-PrlF toxin-antitoxin module